jgi:hypothetical protein
MEVTRELIEDVAAELGINEPSLVEKDFQVVQALSLLPDYHSPSFELVFAGGTCLSKIFATYMICTSSILNHPWGQSLFDWYIKQWQLTGSSSVINTKSSWMIPKGS